MTITVIGAWDLAWSAPISELDLWQFALKEYAVDEWLMSPVSGIASGVLTLTEGAQMEPQIVQARAQGKTVVFCDEAAPADVRTFTHPENPCYVLGRSGFSPYVSFYRPLEGDLTIKIPTTSNLGGFWPHQAIAIILHDRLGKVEAALPI